MGRWPEQTTKQRFMCHVTKDSKTGCWEWGSYRMNKGYGKFNYEGQPYYAHRIAAVLWLNVSLFSAVFICHHCDNRRCVNPKHLFVSDAKGNALDALQKGRKLGGTKLTKQKIVATRSARTKGETITALGKRFSVHHGTISRICLRRTWCHVI